jgi:hypothetical protein
MGTLFFESSQFLIDKTALYFSNAFIPSNLSAVYRGRTTTPHGPVPA